MTTAQWAVLMGVQKTRSLREMWTAEAQLMGFQRGTRILPLRVQCDSEPGCLLAAPWNPRETEFESNGLVCLTADISRQDGIQPAVWPLLTTLVKAYRENSDTPRDLSPTIL